MAKILIVKRDERTGEFIPLKIVERRDGIAVMKTIGRDASRGEFRRNRRNDDLVFHSDSAEEIRSLFKEVHHGTGYRRRPHDHTEGRRAS